MGAKDRAILKKQELQILNTVEGQNIISLARQLKIGKVQVLILLKPLLKSGLMMQFSDKKKRGYQLYLTAKGKKVRDMGLEIERCLKR